MKAIRFIIVALISIVALVVAGTRVARTRLNKRLTSEVDELLAGAGVPQPGVVTEEDISGLPEPVQRWMHYAGVIGKPRPATVRLKQEGHFRMSQDADWMPFVAEEYYTTEPPGFIWITTMTMAPMVTIHGRDRYAGGHGSIEMRLMSTIPVAQATGPEMDLGSMLRYLNETMWFPAAVLSPYISWEAIDERSARATMRYGGISAEATFIFDEQGRMVDMRAGRYEMSSGELHTWSTPISDYAEFEGMRVPSAGEGVWKLEGGDFSYIRLRITDLQYDPSGRY